MSKASELAAYLKDVAEQPFHDAADLLLEQEKALGEAKKYWEYFKKLAAAERAGTAAAEAENAKLRAALEFYAMKENWESEPNDATDPPAFCDEGKRAREALGKDEK
jgi:hypothetical protein